MSTSQLPDGSPGRLAPASPGVEDPVPVVPRGRPGAHMPQVRQETLLEQLWRTVRYRKWVVLQALILIPLAALLFSLAQTKQYTATSSVLFRDSSTNPLGDQTGGAIVDPTREAATNTQLLGLPIIAERASQVLGGQVSAGEIQSAVSIDATDESDVVEVSATADSPELSAQIANAYVRGYINFRRTADRARISDAIDLAESELKALPPAQQNSAQAERLNARIDQLQTAQSLQTGNAEAVQRATPPSSPSSPKTIRNVIIGLLLGGFVGLGLAALLERLDRRIKRTEDLERIFGLPIIARVPRSPTLAASGQPESEPLGRGVEGEAFRTLRANLRYFSFRGDLRTILIASPDQGDGKSTVARFLATTMADMGDRVVLVEADLHKRGSTPDSPRRSTNGLSTVLAGGSLDEALIDVHLRREHSTSRRKLVVLPSGPVPPNPSELLESDRMREVLRELERRFDLVIVDTPPLTIVSDGLALVPEVSGVVLVSGLGNTLRTDAVELRKELGFIGGKVYGVVANFTSSDKSDSSYYYGEQAA